LSKKNPIGVFDSGIGGLTVLKEIRKRMPEYDYVYLGDSARAPYGTRSFETVYRYTLQCVQWFFVQGCDLVVLACNTASAKALKSIQQNDLPKMGYGKRVLGVLRPSTETIGHYTKSGHVGILATSGTVNSDSYPVEIRRFFPQLKVSQHACPMWVPLVENREHMSPGADYFIEKDVELLLNKDPEIDTILLGCTHYPLLEEKIRKFVPDHVSIISQGSIVAEKLEDYLNRHPDMKSRISTRGSCLFFTTDSVDEFNSRAQIFFEGKVKSEHVELKV
jgi:glutamate racemase